MQVPQSDDPELVDQGSACPICGERHPDKLVWLDEEESSVSSADVGFNPKRAGLSGARGPYAWPFLVTDRPADLRE